MLEVVHDSEVASLTPNADYQLELGLIVILGAILPIPFQQDCLMKTRILSHSADIA